MTAQGLLWYDDTPNRSLADKVTVAVARYQKKYHGDPDVVYVNPDQLPGDAPLLMHNVRVVASPTVMLNHLWLCIQS
jgi:hypothetical protein